MKVIQFNPFRYLGLFANATLKEQTAAVAQMKAFARVGQNVDNPLRLPHCFGELLDDEKNIIENESRLTLPDEREQHAFFWFTHGPDSEEDLKAVDLIDQGLTTEAIKIWKGRPDREALQNLMVTALLVEDLKEATRLAQQLHHTEQDIRRFVLALTDEFKWLTMQTLLDYTSGNTQWMAVLKDMQLAVCRKNIENCLDNAERENDLETYEALYRATADLDQMREILGPDNITYQTLADQLAQALVMDKFAPFRVQNPFKWFDKAYTISVQEETRTLVIFTTLSFFKEIVNSSVESKDSAKEYQKQVLALISYDGPITELKEEIQMLVKNQKTVNHWKIGCGILGLLILIVLYTTLGPGFSRKNKNQPPEITLPEPIQLSDSFPYHQIDIPNVPDISDISFDQTNDKLQESDLMIKYRSLDSNSLHFLRADIRLNDEKYRNMSDEEWEKIIDSLLESSAKSSEGETTPTNSANE